MRSSIFGLQPGASVSKPQMNRISLFHVAGIGALLMIALASHLLQR